MIDPTFLTTSVVSLSIIGWVLFRECPRMCADAFRADVRRIRNELFDQMRLKGLDFNDPQYRYERQQLNGLIRLSSSLSTTMYLSTIWFIRKHGSFKVTQYVSKTKEIREIVQDARTNARKRLIRYVFLEGVTGVFAWSVLALAFIFRASVSLRSATASSIENLLDVATVVGGNNAGGFQWPRATQAF